MEIITLVLAVWLLVLQTKVNKQGRSISQVEKKLSRFRVIKKKKESTQDEVNIQTPRPVVSGQASQLAEDTSEHKPAAQEIKDTIHPSYISQSQVSTDNKIQGSEFFDQGLETFLIKKILPAVGVLSILLGLIFVLTWSFTNDLIGPGTLIIFGVVASSLLVFVGEYLRSGFEKQYAFVTAAGLLGLGASVYTSHGVYDYISTATGFVLYILIIGMTFGLSLAYNNRTLSFLGAAGSALVPLLVATTDPQPYVLMGYLSCMFVAGAIVMYVKEWRETVAVTFASLVLYATGLISGVPSVISPTIFLAWLYGTLLLFTAVLVVRALKEKEESNFTQGSVVSLFVSWIIINIFGYLVFQEMLWPFFGFFVLAQGVIFYLLSWLFGNSLQDKYQELFLTNTLISLVFATLFEVGFDGQALVATFVFVAQSVLGIYMYHQTQGRSLKLLYGVFAVATEGLAVFSLFFIDGFWALTLGIFAVIVSALLYVYAWELNEENANELVITQLSLVGILSLLWNFYLLPQELFGYMKYTAPYVIAFLISTVLLRYWLHRENKYTLVFSLLFSILAAIHFVFSVSGKAPGIELILVFGVVVASVSLPLLLSYYFKAQEHVRENRGEIMTGTIGAWALLYVWFVYWVFNDPLVTGLIAIFGLVYIVVGLLKSIDMVRKVGLVLVALVALKIYAIDIWSLSTLLRFAALLPLGIILISLPFWYHKLKK